jgi:hypothetical protein
LFNRKKSVDSVTSSINPSDLDDIHNESASEVLNAHRINFEDEEESKHPDDSKQEDSSNSYEYSSYGSDE